MLPHTTTASESYMRVGCNLSSHPRRIPMKKVGWIRLLLNKHAEGFVPTKWHAIDIFCRDHIIEPPSWLIGPCVKRPELGPSRQNTPSECPHSLSTLSLNDAKCSPNWPAYPWITTWIMSKDVASDLLSIHVWNGSISEGADTAMIWLNWCNPWLHLKKIYRAEVRRDSSTSYNQPELW